MAQPAGQAPHAPCNICMEPMAPSEAHRGGSGCAHAFCRACLAGHVRAKVEAGAAAVRCPDASCAGALDAELCRAALPGDLFVRWCGALCESMFMGARRTYCPFPDCSEMMVADDDSVSDGCVTQSECQVCRRLFCANCLVPWHAGVSCAEFASKRLVTISAAMAEGAAQAPHPCSICLEPMAPSEAHRGGISCAHAFCRSCLEGHVRAKVESGRAATVRCLDATCGSKLDPELCRAVLPDDVFERWCAALCESIFVGARRTYCPFPDCSEMMVADDDGERVTQSECQVCRRLFCAQCGVPWHAGVDCAAYKHLGKVDTAREDMMVLEMAKGKKWLRCPRCQFFVEKTDGCMHITCRCGNQFCYGCGLQWADSSHSGCTI